MSTIDSFIVENKDIYLKQKRVKYVTGESYIGHHFMKRVEFILIKEG